MELESDIFVIGAGIVGLATAYQLLKMNPALHLTILEKEDRVACHQTGRNSGVVHSGIYYKPGSLKAKNCIAGKKELIQFCDENRIPCQTVGKVIVATGAGEIPYLKEIESRGRANGVILEPIGPERLKEIEPCAQGVQALWIPHSQIISYPKVAEALADQLVKMGAKIIFGSPVTALRNSRSGCIVETPKGAFKAKVIVNCAGLFSDRVAEMGLGRMAGQQIIPFRGEYYELTPERRGEINGLIYPVPDPNFPFLGVHLTRRIDGTVEAGPNAVLALAREGYRKWDFDFKDCLHLLKYPGFWKMAGKYWRAGLYELARSLSKKLFLRDLQRLVPSLEEKDLTYAGSGVRAQAVSLDGKLLDDFSIKEEKNMIHVLNAPSPAATASFAIGRMIAARAIDKWENS